MNTNIETIFRCDRCDQDFPIFEKIEFDEFEDDQFCCECLNMSRPYVPSAVSASINVKAMVPIIILYVLTVPN